MQYPVPVPLWDSGPPRMVSVTAATKRFAHLPLVKGLPDGTLEVVRGDADLAERLLKRPESVELFGADRVNLVCFVLENRLGDLHFSPVGRKKPVGLMEQRLYTAPARFGERLVEATTMDEFLAALDAERARLTALAADGWELARVGSSDALLLVDALRPDEDLTEADLP